MPLYFLFGLIIANFFIGSCNSDIPKDAFKYEVSDEMIFFEKIIDSFLQEEPSPNEPLLVEVRPLRTDTTMTKQEWNKWLEGQNKLITSREEILANKNLEKVDIEVYQSCNFPSQMMPPKENEPDVKLSEQCKDLEDKQALEVSLSQHFQDDKNGREQRKVRATLFLNYGHIEYEFLFHKENQKWVIAEKKRVSGILS